MEKLRDTLAQANTSIQLNALALVFAVICSLVIIVFRLAVEFIQGVLDFSDQDYSVFDIDWRVSLPAIGALLIWLIIHYTRPSNRHMGIAYVLHRIKMYAGHIPSQTLTGQFVHALIALVCGFSVGREGPSIHLGAATASSLSRKLRLPDNSVRILASSGVAAGIAATFNTPLAAVIFVFEVILREYRLQYFFPIVTAAICGALASHLAFGDPHAFDNINLEEFPISQYPVLAIAGLVFGVVAAAFNWSLIRVTKEGQRWPLGAKLMSAGIITCAIGATFPQALGTGEAAILLSISESPALSLLVAVLLAKVVATVAAIGLGIPGGLIGPLYGLGALLGAIIAWVSIGVWPELSPYVGLYVVIGMSVMFSVGLGAPLAALVALVELTGNVAIILPALFVTVPAFLLCFQGFGVRSILLQQLDINGLDYRKRPMEQALQKYGVRQLMDRRLVLVKHDQALLLEVLKRAQGRSVLLEKEDGSIHMIELQMQSFENEASLVMHPIKGLPDTASLDRVFEILSPKNSGEVYIFDQSGTPVGVISWASLTQLLRKKVL
ncbi:chloride channel protein [Paraferrimonas sedimenticola]|uniref:Chloride channel protein n=1 Tax=Paraferrimonas sedimenticola TaxID=375674 RepID=A0AA37VUE3_9GAMM|nr:chloride channel protein [Paraferrimonas sedimenticola]GLP95621.1 chloride channel protein [Paraferrimonas sedimenticola]